MITISTLIVFAVGFAVGAVAGAVFSYLFLRANPKKRANIDDVVDRAKDQF